jgi:hypothetical protein
MSLIGAWLSAQDIKGLGMGLFGGPPKLNLSEYRDVSALTSEQKFILRIYAMHAVGLNPLGTDGDFLPEREINDRLRKAAVDPNDLTYILNLLLDRRMMRIFS